VKMRMRTLLTIARMSIGRQAQITGNMGDERPIGLRSG
jgi:hypothetical protein